MRNPIAGILICLVVFACGKSPDESTTAPAPGPEIAPSVAQRSIEAVADEFLLAYLQRRPETGTYFSLPNARHDRLLDNTPAARFAWEAEVDDWLEELDAIGRPQDVGSRDWVSFGVIYEWLAASKAIRLCHNELWSVSTTTAWYNQIPSLFEIQPVDTVQLQQQALDRLNALAVYIDNEIINLRKGLELGYSTPRLTAMEVPSAVRGLLEDNSPLFSPAVRAENPEFSARLEVVFEQVTAPAIERFARFMEEEYLPQAREEIAITANPDGAECYTQLVRYYATISPTAEEIHALGLQQIAGIRAEMQAIIEENFEGETIDSLMRNLNLKPEYTFATREDVLAYALASLDASKEAMPRAFGLLPRADMIIKPYPAYREASGTGEYHSSSEDGSRPGIYYIAVVDPTHRSIAGQQSVLYHEGYPGHHLQGAIALELGDRVHPIVRYLWNSGFGEGWALYSERLADELGLFDGPLDKIGLLSDQAGRAARLVIDSGLHAKGWTRQQAVDYMLANTAWSPRDIESEINRYISWPGQANSYTLGMLEIRRLRNLAELELADKFDLRAFHDRVLGSGSITLPMLEESILSWIAEQR
ncbi:DUF885 family protein [Pseudomonadota bacterium]